MERTLRDRARSEGGFTLIELLVVMIIIAILMAVAVPTFLAQKNTAQKSKATANIKQIVTAIESCGANITNGTFVEGTTNCLDETSTTAGLRAYEKSLNQLTYGATAAPNTYNVVENGTQGYSVQTWVQDGDRQVTFAENHLENGTVAKICSVGTTYPTIATTATAGVGSAESRICATGKWG